MLHSCQAEAQAERRGSVQAAVRSARCFGYSAVHWLHRTPTALAGALPRSATARSMVCRAASYGVS